MNNNNNKLFILLYLLLLLLMVWMEFRASETTVESISNRDYRIDENPKLDEIFQEYQKPLGFNKMNVQWGIVKKKIVEKKTIKELNVTKQVNVTVKEKTLCIEKECFKLLGTFKESTHSYASFYNQEHKEKIQVFLVGEKMFLSVKLKSIMKNKIVFTDNNSTREWSIKMFDINSSKYKPKDFE